MAVLGGLRGKWFGGATVGPSQELMGGGYCLERVELGFLITNYIVFIFVSSRGREQVQPVKHTCGLSAPWHLKEHAP